MTYKVTTKNAKNLHGQQIRVKWG